MHGARAIGARLAIPAVAIPRDPRVDSSGNPANPGHEQNPRHQTPSRKKYANARPGIRAAENTALRIHRLHPARGRLPVNLRKTPHGGRIVEVEEFDASALVPRPHALDARAAQSAGTVVKNRQLSHILAARILCAFILDSIPSASGYDARKRKWPHAIGAIAEFSAIGQKLAVLAGS